MPSQARHTEADSTSSRALFRAMWQLHGREYLAIGLIKLLGDVLNFAGPFLLQALLRHENMILSMTALPPTLVCSHQHIIELRVHGLTNGTVLTAAPSCRELQQPESAGNAAPRFEWSASFTFALLLGASAVLKGILNAQYTFRKVRHSTVVAPTPLPPLPQPVELPLTAPGIDCDQMLLLQKLG